MPMEGIIQPDIITISDTLRLRKFSGDCAFALDWYQDKETLLLVDGKTDPYDMKRLCQMYHYLQGQGELYWIEYKEKDSTHFIPVGDVTFGKEDIPIVIGDSTLRGMGIGKQVIRTLIARARALGFDVLRVADIYDYNVASRKLFEACGFRATEFTEKGHRYECIL